MLSVTAAGGQLAIAKGALKGAQVTVPSGAVDQASTLSLQLGMDFAEQGAMPIGPALELGPAGTMFKAPVSVTLPLGPATSLSDGSKLVVIERTSAEAQALIVLDPMLDTANETVAVTTSSAGTFQAAVVTDPLTAIEGSLSPPSTGTPAGPAQLTFELPVVSASTISVDGMVEISTSRGSKSFTLSGNAEPDGYQLSASLPALRPGTYTAMATGTIQSGATTLPFSVTWTFTITSDDTTAPTVSSTMPSDQAVGVPLDGSVSILFSEAMDPSTLNLNTIVLKDNHGGMVSAMVSAHDNAATLDYTGLRPASAYTVTVATAALDLAGNALAMEYVLHFMTVDAIPAITNVSPMADATGVVAAPPMPVIVTFSRDIDPKTITSNSFSVVDPGHQLVAGELSYSSNGSFTATFTPSFAWAGLSTYTVHLTTQIQGRDGTPLASDRIWSFTTGAAASAPTVQQTSPSNNATGVDPNMRSVGATFSRAVNASTLTQVTFACGNPGLLAGSVSYDMSSLTATWTAASDLPPGVTIHCSIAHNVTDTNDIPLAADYGWQFQTRNSTPPRVLTTTPTANATAIALDAHVVIDFDRPMLLDSFDPAATFVLSVHNGSSVSASVHSSDPSSIELTPDSALQPSTQYDVLISGNVTDQQATPLSADYGFSFTTLTPDTTPPTVVASSEAPAANATDVDIAALITLDFSEALDPASVTQSSFTVLYGSSAIQSGTLMLSNGGTRVTFTPSPSLAYSTSYAVTATTAITDLAGNPLAQADSWSFTTAPAPFMIWPGSEYPSNGATNVGSQPFIQVDFSHPIDESTVIPSTFYVVDSSSNLVAGSLNFANSDGTVIFLPASLPASTSFTATVTTGVQDKAHMPLPVDFSWSFSTGP